MMGYGDGVPNIDMGRLTKLGFTQQDVECMQYMLNMTGRCTAADLQRNGVEYERSLKIKYLYDICCNKVNIETKDDLAKHFRKMFGAHRRIGITDLAISRVTKVPRWALIGGINDPVYKSLNSNQLPVDKRLYTVEKVTSRIIVSTLNPLVIPYGHPKKIDGVIEVLGRDRKTNKIILALDRKHCKLCNRYIIVASLRAPETHHGMVQIICVEGTKLYVYAKTLGIKENVSYSGGTARVYDYGIFASEITPRVKSIAEGIYQKMHGVYAETVPANEDFQLISKEQPEIEIQE